MIDHLKEECPDCGGEGTIHCIDCDGEGCIECNYHGYFVCFVDDEEGHD